MAAAVHKHGLLKWRRAKISGRSSSWSPSAVHCAGWAGDLPFSQTADLGRADQAPCECGAVLFLSPWDCAMTGGS